MNNLLVRNGEFPDEMSNHLRLDLDGDVLLPRVQLESQSQHLRNDDHVSDMGLDGGRLTAILFP